MSLALAGYHVPVSPRQRKGGLAPARQRLLAPQGGFRFLGFYGLRATGSAPSSFTIRRLAIGHGDQLGPSGIVINTGPFEHIGFAIFAIEAAGALVRGVLLRRLIIQAALRARKHDRGLCYGGHPAIMR